MSQDSGLSSTSTHVLPPVLQLGPPPPCSTPHARLGQAYGITVRRCSSGRDILLTNFEGSGRCRHPSLCPPPQHRLSFWYSLPNLVAPFSARFVGGGRKESIPIHDRPALGRKSVLAGLACPESHNGPLESGTGTSLISSSPLEPRAVGVMECTTGAGGTLGKFVRVSAKIELYST